MTSVRARLFRRRPAPHPGQLSTPLRRCLGTADLTLLGVGNMVGAGVFLLTGPLARDEAGPGIVLAYLLAGGAVTLSALCFAEFGARIPCAGSAYSYTYVTMGELCAFLIGWNVILQRLLSAAAVARGWSSLFDAMLGGAVRNGTLQLVGDVDVPGLSEYPDFLAAGVVVMVILLQAVGVRWVMAANTLLTALSVAAVLTVAGVCLSRADWDNWTAAQRTGFLPYGFKGVLSAAATLFYAFVGFESISIAGEEATNPATQVPRASLIAMATTTTLYVLASAGLTLMTPFTHLDPTAAFPAAMLAAGMPWAVYVVSVGGLLGVTTTLLADLYALPRTAYAMADDGLLFSCCACVSSRTHTPVVATLLFGIPVMLCALFIDYLDMIQFLSIASLLTFAVVAIGIIHQRYQPIRRRAGDDVIHISNGDVTTTNNVDDSDVTRLINQDDVIDDDGDVIQYPTLHKECTWAWLRRVRGDRCVVGCVVGVVGAAAAGAVLGQHAETLGLSDWWQMVAIAIIGFIAMTSVTCLSAYEQTFIPQGFQVPLVPYTPCLSLAVNIVLLAQLPLVAWARYTGWIILGLVIYFAYGYRHSKHGNKMTGDCIPMTSYTPIPDDTTDDR